MNQIKQTLIEAEIIKNLPAGVTYLQFKKQEIDSAKQTIVYLNEELSEIRENNRRRFSFYRLKTISRDTLLITAAVLFIIALIKEIIK